MGVASTLLVCFTATKTGIVAVGWIISVVVVTDVTVIDVAAYEGTNGSPARMGGVVYENSVAEWCGVT